MQGHLHLTYFELQLPARSSSSHSRSCSRSPSPRGSSSCSHPPTLCRAQVKSGLFRGAVIYTTSGSSVCSSGQYDAQQQWPDQSKVKLMLVWCPGPAAEPQHTSGAAAPAVLTAADVVFTPPEKVDQSAPYRTQRSPVPCALADRMPSLASFRTRARPQQQQQQQQAQHDLLPATSCQAPRQLPPLAALIPCPPIGQHPAPHGQQATALPLSAPDGPEVPFQVQHLSMISCMTASKLRRLGAFLHTCHSSAQGDLAEATATRTQAEHVPHVPLRARLTELWGEYAEGNTALGRLAFADCRT